MEDDPAGRAARRQVSMMSDGELRDELAALRARQDEIEAEMEYRMGVGVPSPGPGDTARMRKSDD